MDDAAAVLPVLPWTLAALATVLVVALSVPPGGPRAATARSRPSPVVSPVVALVATALAVAALVVSRVGPRSELDNPVPALVLGLGLPALLLLPGLLGLVRPRVVEAGGPPPSAWPAAAAALAVVGFLVLPAAPTRPSSVGTAVAAYALVALAVGLALGRRLLAERVDALGLLAAWGSVGRALPRWAAPPGALAVLAVVLGGAWAERYERSAAWSGTLHSSRDVALGLLAGLALAGAGAGALHLATRRGGAAGTAAAVLLPLAVATGAAGLLRRAMISAQLLAAQAAGPRSLEPDPLGIAGGQLLSLGVVVLGAALSCAVLARRMGEETARLPGVGVLLALAGVSAWVVLQP